MMLGLFSNEVQNFLYLSREFDTSHVGEGMVDPGLTQHKMEHPILQTNE